MADGFGYKTRPAHSRCLVWPARPNFRFGGREVGSSELDYVGAR